MDRTLLNAVWRVADEFIRPRATATDLDGPSGSIKDNLRLLASKGYLGLSIPRDLGGLGADETTQYEYTEVLASACGVTAFTQHQLRTGIKYLLECHNEPLKCELLPRLATGQLLCGIAISQLRLIGQAHVVAERVDGGYRIHGTIPWITAWSALDGFVVGASVDKGENHLLAYVDIDRHRDCLTAGVPLPLVVMGSSDTVQVEVRDLIVPAHHILQVQPHDELPRFDDRMITTHTALPLGCARASERYLRELSQNAGRKDLEQTATALMFEINHCRREALTWNCECVSHPDYKTFALRARAGAIVLAMRAAHAAVAAGGGVAARHLRAAAPDSRSSVLHNGRTDYSGAIERSRPAFLSVFRHVNVEATAEELLKALQELSLATASSAPLVPDFGTTPHRRMRTVERAYGSAATRYGRRLSDLLAGSAAWHLFEKTSKRTAHLPQIHDLTHCEPLLRIMRESGELEERERLLRERDDALVAVWSYYAQSEIDKRSAEQEAYDRYKEDISRLTSVYKPYYQKLRRAAAVIPPLVAPRVRSRALLMPPATATLFGACHCHKETLFDLLRNENRVMMQYSQGRHGVIVGPASDRVALSAMLENLDDMAWDVAAISVCAFFVRTSGNDPAAAFPLLIDDYFEWRGVDPRKRTVELRQEIDARIRLLCSDGLRLYGETELWIPDPQSGRRKRTVVLADGSFLVRKSDLFRQSAWQSDTERGPLYGHLVTLGPWAKTFVTERAMIGLFPRQLAQYDLRRQQWERRIGWYLTFQMNNQGSKMRFDEVADAGKKRRWSHLSIL